MKRWFFLFLITALFCLGCATTKKNSSTVNPNLLEPQTLLKFSDIPVPVGFKSIPEESYSFESSGMRVGVLKYSGKADIEQVLNFYKEQMPMHNWRLLNVIEYGESMMNFDRELETCIVNLAVNAKIITITISFGPKSQPPKKPVK